MKNTIKKILVSLLLILLIFTIGCNEKEEVSDTTDLSWYINFSWFSTDWGSNMVSKAITEKTGCNIKFVVPTGDPNEKLNSMISSDSLPDIITLGWWEPEINQLIIEDKVCELDKLANKYEPYFYKVTDTTVRKWFTSDNGRLYQYPNSACTPSDYEKYDNLASNETFMVRKDIYEAIGSPDMTTPKGFANAVEKAAKMFPTVDGRELIPIGCTEFNDIGCDSFDNYLMDFLAVPYVDKNGDAIDRHKNKDLITWLKTFRKLSSKGLLKDEIFLDTRTQMSEKIARGQYFCMLYQYTDMEAQEKALKAKDPNSIYIAVDGPKNSKKDDYTLPGTSVNGWTVTLISQKCANKEKAIKLMTYLLSEEGQKVTWLGVEGKTWDYDNNGKPKMKDDVKNLLITDRNAYDKKYGADSCYWMLQNTVLAAQWLKDDINNPVTQLKQWTYPYTQYVGQYTIVLDTTTSIGKLKNTADKLWGNTLPKLLTAKSDKEFDKIYNSFIKKRYSLGYDKVLIELTKKINDNKIKLGLDK